MAEVDLIQTLVKLLNSAFPGCTIDLEAGAKHDRVAGFVIWEGFQPLDQIDRQQELRKALSALSKEDLLQIGPILTMTPFEASDDDEEDAA